MEWLPAAAAELSARSVRGTARLTNDFNRTRRAPIERCLADGNAAPAAEANAGSILRMTTRARHLRSSNTWLTPNGGLFEVAGTYSLKRTIATSSAKFYSFCEARAALRAGDNVWSAYRAAGAAIQTAAARRRKVLASGRALKLRLNDLLDAIGAYFYYSFIINFACTRHSQHVLARDN